MLPPNPTTAPRGGGAWREDVALERIAALLGTSLPAPQQDGWGDDAAVLARPEGRLLFCCDAGVEDVHLDTALFPVADLGYRTVIAALSDVAAMGGRPVSAVVSICAPGDVDVVGVEAAVVEAAATSGCTIVGGDLSRAGCTSVTVAVLGELTRAGPVRRDGARPGDTAFVTGPLGGAAMGLRRRREGVALDEEQLARFRRPVARVAEGQAAARLGATAMIDVSDGLVRDLRRLACASGVGVKVDVVPCGEDASMDEAMGGGEDYELLFADRTPMRSRPGFEAAGLAAPHLIGTVDGSRRRGARRRRGGTRRRVAPRGLGGLDRLVARGGGGFMTRPARMHEVQTLTPLRRAVHERTDALDVGVPAPLGPAVRVAQVHAEGRLLPAQIADRLPWKSSSDEDHAAVFVQNEREL